MNRKAKKHTPTPAIGACTFEVRVNDNALQLFPAGEFDALQGAMLGSGPWNINTDSAARVIARAAARKNDLVIDYEHQTLKTAANGQPAPAAGWVKPVSLEWREGEGLFARSPDWTDKAAAHIDAKEYKYLSPVFSYSKKSGEVLDILHIALTNTPAIDGMSEVGALAAAKFDLSQPPHEENSMNEELLLALGLKPGATEEEALAAASALLHKVTDLEKQVEEKDEAIAAATAATPDTAVAAMSAMRTELADLKAQVNGNEIDDLVTAALTTNKLVPAQEQWARDLGESDLPALKGYLDSAQSIAALKGQQTDENNLDEEGKTVLTDAQLAVCSQMGVSPEDYLKTLEG
ncbi:MAG: phage protease [Candidatus Sedimenticola sp. (ex Thyasira tokunagai)]